MNNTKAKDRGKKIFQHKTNELAIQRRWAQTNEKIHTRR